MGHKGSYTQEEKEFIAQHYARGHRWARISVAFNERFNPRRTVASLRKVFYAYVREISEPGSSALRWRPMHPASKSEEGADSNVDHGQPSRSRSHARPALCNTTSSRVASRRTSLSHTNRSTTAGRPESGQAPSDVIWWPHGFDTPPSPPSNASGDHPVFYPGPMPMPVWGLAPQLMTIPDAATAFAVESWDQATGTSITDGADDPLNSGADQIDSSEQYEWEWQVVTMSEWDHGLDQA